MSEEGNTATQEEVGQAQAQAPAPPAPATQPDPNAVNADAATPPANEDTPPEGEADQPPTGPLARIKEAISPTKKKASKKKAGKKKKKKPGEPVTGYRVNKPMLFNGVRFEIGDVFAQNLVGCSPKRLRQLKGSRKLSDEIITADAPDTSDLRITEANSRSQIAKAQGEKAAERLMPRERL